MSEFGYRRCPKCKSLVSDAGDRCPHGGALLVGGAYGVFWVSIFEQATSEGFYPDADRNIAIAVVVALAGVAVPLILFVKKRKRKRNE